jgi:Peptidase inhibitor family I36
MRMASRLVGSGVAVLALALGGAGVAQASSGSSPDSVTGVHWKAPTGNDSAARANTAAASGNFYGYRDPYYGGGSCAWPNDDSNLGDNCGGMRNVISSAWNDSSQGNVVRLYFHTGYSGAYACLGPGDWWYDFAAQNVHFSFRPGLDGYNRSANDEVASFSFNRACS